MRRKEGMKEDSEKKTMRKVWKGKARINKVNEGEKERKGKIMIN